MKDDTPPAPLPPALLETLRRELTKSLLSRVEVFAKSRVGILRRANIPTSDPDREAELLVQDAAAATILGHRRWDPVVPLFDHLCGVVRSETSNRAANAQRNRHVSIQSRKLDDSQDDNDPLHARIANRGPIGLTRPGHIVSTGDAARRLCKELRRAARGKPATVEQLIDAYEAGCTDRKEILEITGMSDGEYRNARRILNRMLDALPHDLREGARDALEITHDC